MSVFSYNSCWDRKHAYSTDSKQKHFSIYFLSLFNLCVFIHVRSGKLLYNILCPYHHTIAAEKKTHWLTPQTENRNILAFFFLICLRHLIKSKTVTKRFFSLKSHTFRNRIGKIRLKIIINFINNGNIWDALGQPHNHN